MARVEVLGESLTASAKWEEKEEGGEAQKHLEEFPSIDSKQRTLSDFIN